MKDRFFNNCNVLISFPHGAFAYFEMDEIDLQNLFLSLNNKDDFQNFRRLFNNKVYFLGLEICGFQHPEDNQFFELKQSLLLMNRLTKLFSQVHGFPVSDNHELFKSFVDSLSNEEKEMIWHQANMDIETTTFYYENYSGGIVQYIRSISREITPESEVVIAEFEQFIQGKNRGVLLYPSSYNDDSDIEFMTERGSELFNQQHQVFIHIDYDRVNGPNFHQVAQLEIVIPLIFRENATLRISKVELKKKSIWILFFASCKNEEVLQGLISNEIGIDTLFCKCDGITQGMGGPEGFRVETMFYGCFFQALHLKRIITEFGTEYYLNRRRAENYYAEIIQWVQENFEEGISGPVLEIMGPQPKMTEIIPQLGFEYSIEEETHHIIQSNNPMFLIDIVRN